MNQTAQRFQDRARRFADILDAVGDRWATSTPCEGWTARDVVHHVIATERDFLARRGVDLGPDPDRSDPAAAWRAHASAVVDAVGRDGVAETAYDGYFGRTTVADTLADFYGWDLVVHGWDVARATGQEWSISDEEAAVLQRTADGWGDALHAEGICGPELPVDADASAQDRLLARLGRDPRWSAA